jgi:Holliday junction DNA helicase RuvA
MIAFLRGTLQAINEDSVMIETSGGMGFLVYVPRPVLGQLGELGNEVMIHTSLIVREDSLTLYGFTTVEQRTLFETMLGVTGVGPRAAVSLLSSATPDELRRAVAQKDVSRLTRAVGVGKKMAERLILELKGKLDLSDIPTAAVDGPPEATAINNELIDLLVSLGYSTAEAHAAIASLPTDAPLDVEERLRLALRFFGGA